MLDKPKECCEMGRYTHQIPMPCNGRVVGVDFCIADLVAALNAANLKTEWSCCGHGEIMPVVGLCDGRQLVVMTRDQLHAHDIAQAPNQRDQRAP